MLCGMGAMDKAESDGNLYRNSLLKIWLNANLHKIQLSN